MLLPNSTIWHNTCWPSNLYILVRFSNRFLYNLFRFFAFGTIGYGLNAPLRNDLELHSECQTCECDGFFRAQVNILRQYCRPETPIVETAAAIFDINICFFCENFFGTVFVIYLRKRLNGKHKIYQAGDQQWIRFHRNQWYKKGLSAWLFWDWELRSQPGSLQ